MESENYMGLVIIEYVNAKNFIFRFLIPNLLISNEDNKIISQ